MKAHSKIHLDNRDVDLRALLRCLFANSTCLLCTEEEEEVVEEEEEEVAREEEEVIEEEEEGVEGSTAYADVCLHASKTHKRVYSNTFSNTD